MAWARPERCADKSRRPGRIRRLSTRPRTPTWKTASAPTWSAALSKRQVSSWKSRREPAFSFLAAQQPILGGGERLRGTEQHQHVARLERTNRGPRRACLHARAAHRAQLHAERLEIERGQLLAERPRADVERHRLQPRRVF